MAKGALFADDTCLCFEDKTKTNIENMINDDLISIRDRSESID